MLNTASTLIQFDFDNTLTIGNVSELIHDQFGPGNWDEVYDKYLNNLILNLLNLIKIHLDI